MCVVVLHSFQCLCHSLSMIRAANNVSVFPMFTWFHLILFIFHVLYNLYIHSLLKGNDSFWFQPRQ